VEGAANFVAGQVAKTGDMKVATPVAVIGIRGTAVKLDISAADGKVDVSVIDQQDGQVHSVQVFKCVPTGVTDPQTGATCSRRGYNRNGHQQWTVTVAYSDDGF